MRVLVSLTLAAACTADPYGIESEGESRPFQLEAEQFVRAQLVERLVMTEAVLDVPIDVRWATNLCPGYDATAVIYREQCYAGLTFGCDAIYVA